MRPAGLDFRSKIAMGGRDDAYVDADRVGAADSSDLVVLQDRKHRQL